MKKGMTKVAEVVEVAEDNRGHTLLIKVKIPQEGYSYSVWAKLDDVRKVSKFL